MKYTILIIDDDKAMHMILRGYLSDDFNLLHAETAQGGINLLNEKPVHFILTDIHMDGMSGIEFLQSLDKDARAKDIPVLVMTSMPSVEKEQKALNYGAADFIDKSLFNEDMEAVMDRIRAKLVTSINIPEVPSGFQLSKKELVDKLIFDISSGDFVTVAQKVAKELDSELSLEHLSFWVINGEHIHLVLSNGLQVPRDYDPDELRDQKGYNRIVESRKPYLINNLMTDEKGGIFPEISEEEGLPAEIGIPLFAITDKELVKNKMKIPPETPLFAYLVLKRDRMFSTKEFKLTSILLMQMGTILWRLYKEM